MNTNTNSTDSMYKAPLTKTPKWSISTKLGLLAGLGAWFYVWFGMNVSSSNLLHLTGFNVMIDVSRLNLAAGQVDLYYAILAGVMFLTAGLFALAGALIGMWVDAR